MARLETADEVTEEKPSTIDLMLEGIRKEPVSPGQVKSNHRISLEVANKVRIRGSGRWTLRQALFQPVFNASKIPRLTGVTFISAAGRTIQGGASEASVTTVNPVIAGAAHSTA